MKDLLEIPVLHVLIVDDHERLRNGLKLELKAQKKSYQFKIADAANGLQAIEKISKNDFDLVLLDYEMGELTGAEVAEKIFKIRPGIKILALSNYNDLSKIEKMKEAGAHGYILKNIGTAELLTAIRTVMGGKPYYSNEVYAKLFELRQRNGQDITLSNRELQVLKLIAQGKTSLQIARLLTLEKSTIDSHRRHLLSKFDVNNTASLLKVAHARELLS